MRQKRITLRASQGMAVASEAAGSRSLLTAECMRRVSKPKAAPKPRKAATGNEALASFQLSDPEWDAPSRKAFSLPADVLPLFASQLLGLHMQQASPEASALAPAVKDIHSLSLTCRHMRAFVLAVWPALTQAAAEQGLLAATQLPASSDFSFDELVHAVDGLADGASEPFRVSDLQQVAKTLKVASSGAHSRHVCLSRPKQDKNHADCSPVAAGKRDNVKARVLKEFGLVACSPMPAQLLYTLEQEKRRPKAAPKSHKRRLSPMHRDRCPSPATYFSNPHYWDTLDSPPRNQYDYSQL